MLGMQPGEHACSAASLFHLLVPDPFILDENDKKIEKSAFYALFSINRLGGGEE
jgi:hypothetical protein